MLVQVCNSSYAGGRGRRILVWGQPGARPYLRIKAEETWDSNGRVFHWSNNSYKTQHPNYIVNPFVFFHLHWHCLCTTVLVQIPIISSELLQWAPKWVSYFYCCFLSLFSTNRKINSFKTEVIISTFWSLQCFSLLKTSPKLGKSQNVNYSICQYPAIACSKEPDWFSLALR
jgi:hypothetical protein